MLYASDVQALPVCDEQEHLVGIISISDITWYFPPGRLAVREIDPSFLIVLPNLITVGQAMTSHVIVVYPDSSLEDVIDILTNRQVIKDKRRFITSIPVVNKSGNVLGFISYLELLSLVDLDNMKVSELMTTANIPVVRRKDTLAAAHQAMQSFSQRGIVVISDENMPVGLLSEIQIARHMEADHRFAHLSVSSIMTDITFFTPIFPSDSIDKIISIFLAYRLTLVIFPIIKDDQICGVISYLDILRTFKQRMQISDL